MAYQSRARLLYLTKVLPYPPAVAGDAVYSRGMIHAWSSVADVTVLCAQNEGSQQNGASTLEWIVTDPPRRGRVGSVLSRFPLIAWKGATPDYRNRLYHLLSQGDWNVIVLDNIGLAHALPQVEAYRRKNPAVRVVYVSHEWEYRARSAKYASYSMNMIMRLIANLDLMKVKYWEKRLVASADEVTVLNNSDLEYFRSIDPSPKYHPVLPGYSGPITPFREITDDVPRRVLLLGGRRSEQKRQVLLDWLKVSYRTITAAGIEMVVVGDMSDDLRSQIQRNYPRVQTLGFIEDLGNIISQARAGLIVDTVGGGFKLRLLSHVFQRLPIIGLSSAIEGLPTPEGKGYLAAPTLSQLVRLVCDAIDDLDRLNSIHKRAFADCERNFAWEQRADTLAALSVPKPLPDLSDKA